MLVDSTNGTLTYANAVHPYPYVYRARTGELEKLPPLDPLLGALEPDLSNYETGATTWAPGDVLVLYTDGITEERDIKGK